MTVCIGGGVEATVTELERPGIVVVTVWMETLVIVEQLEPGTVTVLATFPDSVRVVTLGPAVGSVVVGTVMVTALPGQLL